MDQKKSKRNLLLKNFNFKSISLRKISNQKFESTQKFNGKYLAWIGGFKKFKKKAFPKFRRKAHSMIILWIYFNCAQASFILLMASTSSSSEAA